MRCFLVGISGYSRTGKDTVAHRLVEAHKAVHLGMTDHAKRHMADAYGFTEEQLFGPSEIRNIGDIRYPKSAVYETGCSPVHNLSEIGELYSGEIIVCGTIPNVNKIVGKKVKLDPKKRYFSWEGEDSEYSVGLPYELLDSGAARFYVEMGDPRFWLSPREVLQKYCILLEDMYLYSLVDYAIKMHLQLVPNSKDKPNIASSGYNRMEGLVEQSLPVSYDYFMTCFSDFRRIHQIKRVRDMANDKLIPVMIRVKRPGIEEPPFDHISETEQATISDSEFDFVVDNDGTISDLDIKIDTIVSIFIQDKWEPLKK